MPKYARVTDTQIKITDPREIAAVDAGEIDGDRYADGEVYAEVKSLLRWRNERPAGFPVDGATTS